MTYLGCPCSVKSFHLNVVRRTTYVRSEVELSIYQHARSLSSVKFLFTVSAGTFKRLFDS